MGKTTTANAFRRLKIPVLDADAVVHTLINGEALPAIAVAFPDTIVNGLVDRKILGSKVFDDPVALRHLESILHPMVQRVTDRWLARHRLNRRWLVVLDIPLLYETGGDKLCDYVAVVSASAVIQAQRVLKRPDTVWSPPTFLDHQKTLGRNLLGPCLTAAVRGNNVNIVHLVDFVNSVVHCKNNFFNIACIKIGGIKRIIFNNFKPIRCCGYINNIHITWVELFNYIFGELNHASRINI
jgi:dephospho-CoA kinase